MVAAVVSVLLLLIALAGADHPPPIGFLILLPLIAGWAYLVAWAIAATSDKTARASLMYCCLAGGLGAGLAIGVLSIGTSAAALIGVVVFGVLGAIGAGFQWLATRLLTAAGHADGRDDRGRH